MRRSISLLATRLRIWKLPAQDGLGALKYETSVQRGKLSITVLKKCRCSINVPSTEIPVLGSEQFVCITGLLQKIAEICVLKR